MGALLKQSLATAWQQQTRVPCSCNSERRTFSYNSRAPLLLSVCLSVCANGPRRLPGNLAGALERVAGSMRAVLTRTHSQGNSNQATMGEPVPLQTSRISTCFVARLPKDGVVTIVVPLSRVSVFARVGGAFAGAKQGRHREATCGDTSNGGSQARAVVSMYVSRC